MDDKRIGPRLLGKLIFFIQHFAVDIVRIMQGMVIENGSLTFIGWRKRNAIAGGKRKIMAVSLTRNGCRHIFDRMTLSNFRSHLHLSSSLRRSASRRIINPKLVCNLIKERRRRSDEHRRGFNSLNPQLTSSGASP